VATSTHVGVEAWHARDRALGALAWLVLGTGTGLAVGASGGSLVDTPPMLLLVVLAAFFAVLLVRLVHAAVHERRRRLSLLSLVIGVTLWAAGSALLNSGGSLTGKSFPSPSEVLFLSSYVGFAVFLLLDTPGRRSPDLTVWLETALVCSGAMSLVGFLWLSPLGSALAADGFVLFVALLYPVLGLVLAVLVLAQVQLGTRAPTGRTVRLAVGLVVLALADSTFVLNASSDTYVSNAVLEFMWGASFALLTGAAVAPRLDTTAPSAVRSPRHLVLVGAAAVALAVLVLRPAGVGAWYVTVPAVITLIAAGARLVLALREARGAVEARRLSVTDDLTGLPNRRAVTAALASYTADGAGGVGLMLLDLDGFKDINDSLGHAAGDRVLVQVAARLTDEVGGSGVVARLGGDEFAVVMPDVDELRLLRLANRIRESLLAPLAVEGLVISVRCSVGITTSAVSADPTDLLRQADVAMYDAKSARSGALLYDSSRDEFSRSRLRQAEDLRRAIAGDQLELWYQPQVDAATTRVVAVEALVRWRHPEKGLLAPLAFLPDARRSGLMPALTEWVVRRVVLDARRWHDQGFDFTVSFNVAPPELLGGHMLPALFVEVARAGLPPDRLLVEVTEDSFVSDPEQARTALQDMRRHGVQAAIDDYGTGFSSLSYLRDLPVQELKMDRSFVSTVLTDSRSRVILDSTRQMAHAMGLRLVAEGVEDAVTAAELVALGVDVLQGYHVSRPVPQVEVSAWVRSWHAGLHATRGLPTGNGG
jgi:diguanylate cyclase